MDKMTRRDSTKPARTGSTIDSILAQWRMARPDLDCRPMAVIGQLWRTSQIAMKAVEANLKHYDLDMAGFDVLLTLRRQDGGEDAGGALTPGDLARDMMLSPPAMTNRIDRLVARGLVERRADPDDRRALRVALTAAGRELADTAVKTHLEVEESLLADLAQHERDDLTRLLARIGQ
ncbi:MarR family winged helix-turn-helix transcriptional regulator [Hoeflea ulvae]|uniref:MarR family transcriptional regulator n=1 Tax=Hoeflea ulvae TaxID=2983764 RepID=A0ABT3YEY2_9HYPH|nr:MarR family transcriptional regulator [Hoeflea ulvae]MCY0094305.1 MarR family transcriptional regulator [Hoeflea ulvae]